MTPHAVVDQSAQQEIGNKAIAQAVSLHLRSSSEVLRSQAARALAKVGDQSVAPALQSLLVDADPDVRVDAMNAYIRCARGEDAGLIRASLIGDPDFEVKKAAVLALATLEDKGSVDLLCALVISRCEDSISWDDSIHGWDEWLDLQPFIIHALGCIGDERCVDSLLAAREDEFGPDMDVAIFSALLQLGGKGADRALEFLEDPDSAVRHKAVTACVRASPRSLTGRADSLLHDSDPRLRIIAITACDLDYSTVRNLALVDPASDVRLAALDQMKASITVCSRLMSQEDCDVFLTLLSDEDSVVRHRALNACVQLRIVTADDCRGLSELVVQTCLVSDKALLELSIPAFVSVVGSTVIETCSQWLTDTDASLERRIYAAKALGELPSTTALGILAAGLESDVQQVRIVSLESMVSWVPNLLNSTDEQYRAVDGSLQDAVLDILASTIRGAARAASSMTVAVGSSPDNHEQNIIWHERQGYEKSTTPLSTLESIEQANLSSVDDDYSVKEDHSIDEIKKSKGARRRVSITGPDDYDEDLKCHALTMCALVADSRIERETLMALQESSTRIVDAALRALHQRYSTDGDNVIQLPGALTGLLVHHTQNDNPSIRYWAASLLVLNLDAGTSMNATFIDELLHDEDALCRSIAMQRADVVSLRRGLADPSAVVRNAVIERIMSGSVDLSLDTMIDILMNNRTPDTLRQVLGGSELARESAAHRLTAKNLDADSVNTLLEALA